MGVVAGLGLSRSRTDIWRCAFGDACNSPVLCRLARGILLQTCPLDLDQLSPVLLHLACCRADELLEAQASAHRSVASVFQLSRLRGLWHGIMAWYVPRTEACATLRNGTCIRVDRTCEILAISLFSLMIYDLGPLLHTLKAYMSERQGLCRLTDHSGGQHATSVLVVC